MGALLQRLAPLALWALLLLAWELAVGAGLANPVLVSSPLRIARAAPELFGSAALHHDLQVTLLSFLGALTLACLCGFALGLLLATQPLAYRLINPFVVAANALPKVVLMPLVVLWVGIGPPASIFLGALMASFPLLVASYSGVRSLERDFLLLGRAFGAPRPLVLREIVLPGLLPFLFSGLRVAINYALVGVLISEFFGASAGIGYRLVIFMSNFEVDSFFVLVVFVALAMVGITAGLTALERRLFRWRPATAGAPRAEGRL